LRYLTLNITEKAYQNGQPERPGTGYLSVVLFR